MSLHVSPFKVVLSFLKKSGTSDDTQHDYLLKEMVSLLSNWGVSNLSPKPSYSYEDKYNLFKSIENLGISFFDDYLQDIKNRYKSLKDRIDQNKKEISTLLDGYSTNHYIIGYRNFKSDLKELNKKLLEMKGSEAQGKKYLVLKEIIDILDPLISEAEASPILSAIVAERDSHDKEMTELENKSKRENEEQNQRLQGKDPESQKYLKNLGKAFRRRRAELSVNAGLRSDDEEGPSFGPSYDKWPLVEKLVTYSYSDEYKEKLKDFKELCDKIISSEKKIKDIKKETGKDWDLITYELNPEYKDVKRALSNYQSYLGWITQEAKPKDNQQLTPYEKSILNSTMLSDLEKVLKSHYVTRRDSWV